MRRFSRVAAVLSLAMSLYCGLLGYQLGAAVGGFGVGPLLAVVDFAVALGVHRGGFLASTPQPQSIDADSFQVGVALAQPMSPYAARLLRGAPQDEIIDMEYRVVL